jgi:dTDP-L-rhamnose 4-epimerase
MNVLITGGAGFIGTHTTRALVAQGHRVRILDSLDPQIHGAEPKFSAALQELAECRLGSVLSLSDCMEALDGIDAVYHMAARTGVGQSMYEIADYVSTNVLGTAVLLEAILKKKVELHRLVLSSSRAIYGEGLYNCPIHGIQHPEIRSVAAMNRGDFSMPCPHCQAPMQAMPTTEDCPSAPLSVYARTKKEQEDYCDYFAKTYKLPVTTLRYFNVYGSGQSLKNPYTGVVSIFFSLLREGKSLSMYESGLPIRDFVHVRDVVQANLLALSTPSAAGQKFNVGSGVPASIADIARTQAQAMKLDAQLDDRGEFRVGDIFACYADLARSRRDLGFQPQVDLLQGMEEFVAWASGEQSENLYDKTVSELRAHGLFGQARRS